MSDGIDFVDLHKRLGGREILRGVDLEAPVDRITFIVGPSGAGKSVTARHAAGLMRPDRGSVSVFGERVDTAPESRLRQVRKACPFVLQGSAMLDGLDLRENVMLGARAAGLGRREARDVAAGLLERVGLTGAGDRMPSEVGPGALMRTAVARALALSPRMIIFDEPTSGLDPAAARRFDALLVQLRSEGVGALVISHDLPSILNVPDRVHLLHEGRILLAGPPSLFRTSDDPVVRQFIDGRADGPLPVW